MRLVKLTSGSTYDPERDWQRMLERLAVVIKKHGRKLELPDGRS